MRIPILVVIISLQFFCSGAFAKDHYKVQIPENWVEIPKEIIETATKNLMIPPQAAPTFKLF